MPRTKAAPENLGAVAEGLIKHNKTLRLIKRKLRTSNLATDGKLYEELEGYLGEAPLLPKRISSTQRATVKLAQENLQHLDALLSRVTFLQIEVAKALKVLARLEVLARSELLKEGFIKDSMTKHAMSSRIALALPQLVLFETEWTALEKLAALVHSRLSDSKDSLKLQMKLDDNARWSTVHN